MSQTINIKPAIRVRGLCVVPGDKSISQRALILSALAKGRSRIENLGTGEDIQSTISVLRALGVQMVLSPDRKGAMVEGKEGRFDAPHEPLDCGNSATTMRLMAVVLASQPFESVLTGDQSLLGRPMEGIAEPLRAFGADVITINGKPPLTIRGNRLRGISWKPGIPSAQIKSAVLLAGLYAIGETLFHETLPTRDHTERLINGIAGKNFVAVDRMERTVTVFGDQLPLPSFDIVIPGDVSSAAFPITLAILLPESSLTVPFVGLNPGRIAYYRHLQAMGAQIVMTHDAQASHATKGEPVGEFTLHSSRLKNVAVDPDRIPAMIDEVPLLAVVSCLSDRSWEITGAERLREKETDRVTNTAMMLRNLGAKVDEHRDGLSGQGGQWFTGGAIDPMGDHRIAMSAAVGAWCAKGSSAIMNPECVNISFPEFFGVMEDLVEYQ